MMPPYGQMLTQEEIDELVAYARAIAQPAYQPASRPEPKYTPR